MDVPVELAPAVERMIADFNRDPAARRSLDYGAPAAGPPRPMIDVPLAVGLFLFAAVFTWFMLSVVPRFEMIFRDFGAKLPTPTIYVLKVSRAFGGVYAWLVVWCFALAIPIATARLRPWPPRRAGARWGAAIFVTVLLIGLTLILIYTLLQLPLLSVIQSVCAGPNQR